MMWLLVWTMLALLPPDDFAGQGDFSDFPASIAANGWILQSVAQERNYVAVIDPPIGDFEIENIGLEHASLYLTTVRDSGEQTAHLLDLAPNQARLVPREQVRFAARVYLVSLQNFRVTPRGVDGSQLIKVREPGRPTPLLVVNAPHGRMSLGLDSSNRVHLGFFGNVVGVWDIRERRVLLNNGRVLPGIP